MTSPQSGVESSIAKASYVLPEEVLIVPAEALTESVRAKAGLVSGELTLTKVGSRVTSSVIDAETADLLQQFRTPQTLVHAIVQHSTRRGLDPEETLEQAFPALQRLIANRILISTIEVAMHGEEILTPGVSIGSWTIRSCIQSLEDSVVYLVEGQDGTTGVLKIAREAYSVPVGRRLRHEAAVMRLLDGRISPRLLDEAQHGDLAYIVGEWRPGVDVSVAAAELRTDDSGGLLDLCCAVLEAYAHLHRQGIVHGDVHPRNVLVRQDRTVTIVDYGLSTSSATQFEALAIERAGVGFFFEPEYASAIGKDLAPCAPTMLGEQYSLAALLYLLLTGEHYVDFSLERGSMLSQIVTEEPRRFVQCGVEPWPEVERALGRALRKSPQARYGSVPAFARHLRVAGGRPRSSDRVHAGHTDRRLQMLLERTLERLDPEGPLFASQDRQPPLCSINYGAAGIAYALYRLSRIRSDARLLSFADAWSWRSFVDRDSENAFFNDALEITSVTTGRISPYHTISGVHAVQAIVGHALGDSHTHASAIDQFVSEASYDCPNPDLTTGKASVILGSAILLEIAHSNTKLLDLGNRLSSELLSELKSWPAILDGGPEYLGLAHGWGGVVYALLRWNQATRTEVAPLLRDRLEELAKCAQPSGRGLSWPVTSTDGVIQPMLPGWCHGSAGYVFLWKTAFECLGDEQYLALATGAAWNAWESTAAVGSLCCGLAGRAYALLGLYRSTGDRQWCDRARRLAERACDGLTAPEFPQDSLYKGELGVAVLAADLGDPERSCMPFFEAEGWTRHG